MMIQNGLSIEGYTVGVLHLQSNYPLPPGNPQHAQTFPFPVAYEAIPLDDPFVLMRGDPALEKPIIAACERLHNRGVRIIVGACGSFAYYQKAVAAASPIPVYTSVLTMMPFLIAALGTKKLGIIAASAASMNDRIYDQCGVADSSRMIVSQMKGEQEFDRMLLGTEPMDVHEMEEATCRVAANMRNRHPDIGAFLLQCSDLPPYGAAIQAQCGLPVHDAVSLIHWAYHCADYPIYSGLQRRA